MSARVPIEEQLRRVMDRVEDLETQMALVVNFLEEHTLLHGLDQL